MREYFTTKLGSFLQLKVQAGVGELLDETHSRLQLPKSRSTIPPPSAESGGKRDWEKSKKSLGSQVTTADNNRSARRFQLVQSRHLTFQTDPLQAAAQSFDVLVTKDKNIRFQHDLDQLPLPIIELNALFTRFDDLKNLAPFFETALTATREFRYVSVGQDGVIERIAPRTLS